MNLIFSRRLAIAIGIALPVAETLRIGGGGSIAWGLDHFILSALLFYGVWRSRRHDIIGSRYLVAAWAFTCGVGYMNLVWRVERILGAGPAEKSHAWVVVATGCGWLLCILGLAASLNVQRNDADKNASGLG